MPHSSLERIRDITQLLPLVRTCARRIKAVIPNADFDDLLGDGAVGLIRAVDTFDAGRGLQLHAYARFIIAGAILNGLRRNDPVPEDSRTIARRAENDRLSLAHERGAFPPLAELEHRHPGLRRALQTIHHRSTPVSLDDVPAVFDSVTAGSPANPANVVAHNDLLVRIDQAIANLPARDCNIVIWHFVDDLPCTTIAQRLRISPQRVSQLRTRALARIRAALA